MKTLPARPLPAQPSSTQPIIFSDALTLPVRSPSSAPLRAASPSPRPASLRKHSPSLHPQPFNSSPPPVRNKSPSPPIALRSAISKALPPRASSRGRPSLPPPASRSTISSASFPASSSSAVRHRWSPIPPRKASACAASVPHRPAALSSLKTTSRSTTRSAAGFIGRSSLRSPFAISSSSAAAPATSTAQAPSAASSMSFPFAPQSNSAELTLHLRRRRHLRFQRARSNEIWAMGRARGSGHARHRWLHSGVALPARPCRRCQQRPQPERDLSWPSTFKARCVSSCAPPPSTNSRHNGTPYQFNGTRLFRYATGGDWTNAHSDAFNLRLYGSDERYRQTFSSISNSPNAANPTCSYRCGETPTKYSYVPTNELGAAAHWSQPLRAGLLFLAGADSHDVRVWDREQSFSSSAHHESPRSSARLRRLR